MSSHLPKDTTPSLGSTYLLDGFPDMEYGEGVKDHGLANGMGALDAELLGDNAGSTNIPDGIVTADELEAAELSPEEESEREGSLFLAQDGGFGNLDDFMKEAEVTDLDWLEVTEQDLERLPENPVDNAIPELEEAWSTEHKGEPGIHFHANVDPDVARFRASLKQDATPDRLGLKVLKQARHKAMRLSASGASWKKIQKEVQAFLISQGVENALHEKDAAYLRKAMDLVKSEHGLAGKVFIRAEAYPGYERGKWGKHLRRVASSARYIIVPKEQLEAVHHTDGWCQVTRKKVVAAVPWKAATRHYTPLLAATGRKVAGVGKEALKAAFAQQGKTIAKIGDARPVHVDPSQRVDAAEAQAQLTAAEIKAQKVDRQALEQEKALKKAQLQIAKWVGQGLLDKATGTKLVKSDLDAKAMLRQASAIITQAPEAGSYSGEYNQGSAQIQSTSAAQYSADEAARASAELRQLRENRLAATTRSAKKEAAVKKKVAKIVAKIEKGLRGAPLRQMIKRTIHADEVEIAAPLLNPVLVDTNALADTKKKAAKFSGPKYTQAPMTRAAALTPSKKEIGAMLRWSRRALNEGSMGDEFDTLLKLKFAKDVRTAAKKELQALRDEHEGLAGNLYVDASAYASKSGTTGCDKGAARHRGNGVRNVLAMDRCNGCVFANIKTDGSTVCQKYNKNLMDKLPAEDTRAIQREAIRLANASDAERTASLFADTYDPGEFNLSNDMDDFDYSFTPSENLSGIWFEGMPDLDME